ncbi:shikimate dehydrogenase family protein [Autumnicola psychrophila]|uniref:Shikimate dehydrogenase n=1 Tax=Autumnicola psychrophila TaxID=3075592 RepID=A0ABU3DUU2_9FLAO|nr:shikimate dehydrogenase [Zunongwangia sp. F225]MDT0687488.1 shikimate dehydrogenase [Zunongwangia sp. F225]
MKLFGLLGKNIDYSFSRSYFSEKFQNEAINAEYRNFDIAEIGQFESIIQQNEGLKGLNVTIPYKQSVMNYLDRLDENAEAIGAVNTIQIEEDKSLTGYNTDYVGFSAAIKPMLKNGNYRALILGTGGASKAVAFAFQKLEIKYLYVSRNPGPDQVSYQDLNEEILQKYKIIINTTPLGTFPNTEDHPDIPYHYLTQDHLAYDLIYNPSTTKFMELAAKNGASTSNGLQMLQLQAEKAWEIWNM